MTLIGYNKLHLSCNSNIFYAINFMFKLDNP